MFSEVIFYSPFNINLKWPNNSIRRHVLANKVKDIYKCVDNSA